MATRYRNNGQDMAFGQMGSILIAGTTATTSNGVSATTTPTKNVGGSDNKSTSNVEDAFDQLFNS